MKRIITLTLMLTGLFAWATNHQVAVSSNVFTPSSLTITAGDTVTWNNTSGSHNVDGRTATYPANPASFYSGSASGSSWTYSYTFTTAGSYTYDCTPHVGFGMVGTVTVNAAATPPTPCSDLFFSEYIEGSSNNKALEVYNPTNGTVDLSNYTVYRANNGSTTPGGTLNMSGMLASGDVYVMGNPSSSGVDPKVIAESDTLSSITYFNGDDALWLTNNVTGDTLDIFGIIGVDPGSSWTVGTGSTSNHTLVRKSTVTNGTKDWALSVTQWDVYPQDTTMYIGSHTSSCVAPAAAPCGDLFFSEYIEGTSNNRALEIYNPTGGTINLSGYTVYMLTGSGAQNTFPLYGTLNSGDVFKIVNDAADPILVSQADTALGWPSVVHFTGDDAIMLVNGTDTIDVFGTPGVDPGSYWIMGSDSSQNITLVRKGTVQMGSTDWTVGATEWDSYPVNTYSNFGSHTSTCLGSSVMPCSDLFFSEYIEGSSNNKGFEIYNPSGSTVNLSGYTVYLSGNGGSFTNSFTLFGSLASGDVFKVTTDQADVTIQSQADTAFGFPSVAHFSGDDALILFNGTDTLDIIGTPGIDPGSSWPVGTGSTKDHTLVRKASIDKGITVWDSTIATANWDVYPQNTYTFFGSHTSTCISGPIPPTVGFTSAGQTHLEDAGTQSVYMTINPISTNAETVKVYVMEGNNITSGDYTLNPAAVLDTLTFNPAAGDDTLMFDVTILDDIIQEGSETITFSIASTSTGLTVGTIATHVFTIDDNDTPIPTYTIDQIDGVDPVNFLLDSAGVECKIIATVLGVDLQGVSSGNTQFTIYDGNGLGVFSSSPTGYIVTEGDQIRIIGTLSQFNGLAQISGDSIVVLSTGNPIPTPTVVTTLDESTESELNRINGVTILDPSQWSNSGSGFNVDISNGTDTFSMRIDNEVDLYSQPVPVGMFDVVGIGGQFDGSDPRNSGYQILPRYTADIIFPAPPVYDFHISEIMPGSVDSDPMTSPDWFEITNYGSTTVDLTGFSFDDDSEVPGTVTFGNVTVAPNEAIVVWRGVSANEAAFLSAWRMTTSNPQVISSDELTGSFPNLGQGGDMVVLYDTNSTMPMEVCKASFGSASAGLSLEFDTTCTFAQNAQDGMRGAYTSNKGDVGSPGNATTDISVKESFLNDVSVYPNPAQDILFIELSGDSELTEMEIYSIGGQKLVKGSFNSNTYQVDVSELPQGMYLLKLTRGSKMAVKNIIIK
jgi:plastocyanin/predicted extracellular nuclease